MRDILGNIDRMKIDNKKKTHGKKKKNDRKINNTYIEVILILTKKLMYIEGYKKNNDIYKYFYLEIYICIVFNYYIKNMIR